MTITKQILAIGVGLAVALTIGLLPAPAGPQLSEVSNQTGAGINLPFTWGQWRAINRQLLDTGVINQSKFDPIAELDHSASDESLVVITSANAGVMLDWLWAFGLGNKNEILETGPMTDPQYGGDPGRFASTGGWTAAVGEAMDHYSHHPFVVLTPAEQTRVENVSKEIYRPCCSNPAYLPDCNHGMAMLGLLELLADEGLSEEEMRVIADGVNAYWFPTVSPATNC